MNGLFYRPHQQSPHQQDQDRRGGGRDSDMLQASRRRHQKPRGSADDTDSSSDDAEQSGLRKMKKKREKKLRRDASLAITSPMALGLKYLVNEDASRASAMERAVLLRAIKPGSITIDQVYKNPGLLRWDHPLILATTARLFSHEIQHAIQRGKRARAQQLSGVGQELMMLLITDQLRVNPDALLKSMNALWERDPSGLSICDAYKADRAAFTTDPSNRSDNIARLDGLCIGYNFHYEGCNNSDCQYGHYCAFHQSSKQQHSSMRCNDNPNKWKKSKKPSNPHYNRNKGGRGRGYNNRRYNNNWGNNAPWGYHHNNMNTWMHHPQYPYHPNQMNPSQFQGHPAPNTAPGNKDRFFNPGGGKK